MLKNLDKSFENVLDRFDESAKNSKEVIDSTKEINIDTEKVNVILELVDQRINKIATSLRKEMKEERKLIIKYQKKSLLINIGIASMAIIAFIFNRILG